MKTIKFSAIVFDLGNVLLPFSYGSAINKLNEIEASLGQKFIDDYKTNYSLHRDFERGKIPEDQFINKMLETVKFKIDRQSFLKYYSEIFTVNEDVVSLLPELKKNYKLFLLSNTDPIHQKYGWKKYEFLKYFDKLILSHEVGAVKPEEKIYRSVEAVSNFPSKVHFFIDDIQEYVDAAKKFGWTAVQFTTYENLLNDFKNYKIKLD